jgi:hypothetical protein
LWYFCCKYDLDVVGIHGRVLQFDGISTFVIRAYFVQVTTHVIPREQLIVLFEKLEPKFSAAPNGNTHPLEVDSLGAPTH